MDSVQLFICTLRMQNVHRQHVNKWMWLCSNKTLFAKQVVARSAHKLYFADFFPKQDKHEQDQWQVARLWEPLTIRPILEKSRIGLTIEWNINSREIEMD